MKVREIEPDVDADGLLAGAQFADAFGLDIGDRPLDARQAAERMMGRLRSPARRGAPRRWWTKIVPSPSTT